MKITARSKDEYNHLYALAEELGFSEDSNVFVEPLPDTVSFVVQGSRYIIAPPKNLHLSNISFRSETKDGTPVSCCTLSGDVKGESVSIEYVNYGAKIRVSF